MGGGPMDPDSFRPHPRHPKATPPTTFVRVQDLIMDGDKLVPKPPEETVFEEAQRLTNGDRQEEYGHPLDDFTCTGRIWAAILTRHLDRHVPDIAPEVVALMLAAGLKGSRLAKDQSKRDSVVDFLGYGGLVPEVQAERIRRT